VGRQTPNPKRMAKMGATGLAAGEVYFETARGSPLVSTSFRERKTDLMFFRFPIQGLRSV